MLPALAKAGGSHRW